LWLWHRIPKPPTSTSPIFAAFCRRFDAEHPFRFIEQTLGWTRRRVRPGPGRPVDLADPSPTPAAPGPPAAARRATRGAGWWTPRLLPLLGCPL
jgi:hypothetical protein